MNTSRLQRKKYLNGFAVQIFLDPLTASSTPLADLSGDKKKEAQTGFFLFIMATRIGGKYCPNRMVGQYLTHTRLQRRRVWREHCKVNNFA